MLRFTWVCSLLGRYFMGHLVHIDGIACEDFFCIFHCHGAHIRFLKIYGILFFDFSRGILLKED